MASFLDVCRFTPTLGGTTDWTVSTAVTGYQTPAAAGAVNGATYRYRAESADNTQWEIGYGAYTVAGTVLARTTVLFNSSGGTSKITFSTVPQVAIVALAEDIAPVVSLRGYLSGLTLSTAGSSATFGIAAGVATDSTNVSMMSLGSAYTKTTSAWAVGSSAGSLDTGAIAANTGYTVYLIQRVDTSVTDVLISTSSSAPTMPTNYTLSRRIGWMWSNGSSQWDLFSQNGDEFLWSAPVNDINTAVLGTAATLSSLRLPTGIKVNALWRAGISAAATNQVLINAVDEAGIAGGSLSAGGNGNVNGIILNTSLVNPMGSGNTRTNTSAQIRVVASGANTSLILSTYGWIDRRGRDS